MARALYALPFTLFAIACTTEPTPADCDPPPNAADFEAGTGEQCFARVEAGAEVPLIAGPQGGYHLWLAVGCVDCGEQARVRVRVSDASNGDEITPETQSVITLHGDVWPQAPGIQISMPGDSWGETPPIPEGTPLDIEVAVLDLESGETVLHEAALSVVLGETVYWDPCDDDPDGEGCCSDCN